MASQLLPLLHCPLCLSTLTAPVTLYCGHSVCAKHVSLPPHLPSSSQSHLHLPLRLSRLTPCPIERCTASPSALSPLPNIPSSSRVTFYPPLGFQPDRDAAAFANIPESRTDITLNKILTIIRRYHHQQAQSSQHLTTVHSDSGSDSQSDVEILDVQGNSPSQPFPVASSSRASGDASPSVPRQLSSDGSQRGPVRTGARKRPRLDAPPQSPDQFEKELLAELACEICLNLLYHPVTSPCQHTFCSRCLHRSLDHGRQCPICRHELPGVSYFQDHPFNKKILSIILKAFPEPYAERGRVIEQEERHARLDTPIFVCQLSFPGLPTVLHFFEPRYRLMLRRCLEKPNPCFGMIMPPSAAGGQSAGNDFGTMLEIKSVRMLPDGRSMVETHGTYRFRIMERGTMDGYMITRIERILDYPLLYPDIPGDTPSISPPVPLIVNADADIQVTPRSPSGAPSSSKASQSGPPRSYAQEMQELVDLCLGFLDQIQRGAAPWVVQRLNRLSHIYGPMPTDPVHFSYWMAMVSGLPVYMSRRAFVVRAIADRDHPQALPIEDMEKAKLLPVKSPLLRLRLVVHWIEQLNSNWFVG
ncbi:PUA-like domain-containing protein [Russula earlei]|uniref:PUA-like domain-containing protein n=1 Tax=Russula earlei TaxID=71964 RepID=A0ACC0UKK0_9AGAM|nr:PUA-like domain-containing protein [Russula earlei]